MPCISKRDGTIFRGDNQPPGHPLLGDRTFVETHMKGARSSWRQEREAAIKNLGEIGSPEALPVLMEALQSRENKRSTLSYYDRMFAAESLGKIGDSGAIPALQDAAAFDIVYLVRAAAIKALEKIARENNIQAFSISLEENSDGIKTIKSPGGIIGFR